MLSPGWNVDEGNAEQAPRARRIPGSARSAALQILAIATAITVVCALQPIPTQGPPHRGGLFSVALGRPTAWRGNPRQRPSKGTATDARCLVAIRMITKANVCANVCYSVKTRRCRHWRTWCTRAACSFCAQEKGRRSALGEVAGCGVRAAAPMNKVKPCAVPCARSCPHCSWAVRRGTRCTWGACSR